MLLQRCVRAAADAVLSHQITPALSVLLQQHPQQQQSAAQCLYATQAARAGGASRRRQPVIAPQPQSSSSSGSTAAVASAASSSLHVSEAMSAAQAAAAAGASSSSRQAETSGDAARKLGVLNDTIKRLNKQLGSGTLMRLGDQTPTHLDCISSGCLTLDAALGGGWARGRVVEVYGPESSGKTTVALHAVAEAQKAGGQAVFVDAEHAFNADFAQRLGVNVSDLIMCQPSCGEDALEVVDQVLRSHAVDLVVVDSVAALLPRAEIDGAIGDQQIASQARLMSYGLRKLASHAHRSNTTVMFINQLRHRVGVIFGNPETTAGGQALKFYASQRVDLRAKERVKSADGKTETGIRVKAKVVKNKVAPPYKSAEFTVAFNRGIDAADNLLEACLAVGVVQGKGSYYYWGEQRLGQGKENVSALLGSDAALRQELTAAVKAAIQGSAGGGGAAGDRLLGGSRGSSSSEEEEVEEEEDVSFVEGSGGGGPRLQTA